MKISKSTQLTLKELREKVNRYERGIINYYGKFYRSAIYRLLSRIDWLITKWVRNKYRKTKEKVQKWLKYLYRERNDLFEHWKYITPTYAQGLRTIRAV